MSNNQTKLANMTSQEIAASIINSRPGTKWSYQAMQELVARNQKLKAELGYDFSHTNEQTNTSTPIAQAATLRKSLVLGFVILVGIPMIVVLGGTDLTLPQITSVLSLLILPLMIYMLVYLYDADFERIISNVRKFILLRQLKSSNNTRAKNALDKIRQNGWLGILNSANLSGANLSGLNLIEANLSGSNLSGSNLIEANLRGANLRGADLRGADLRGADLRGADLNGAYLIGADLRGADLNLAHLKLARLNLARLTGAHLIKANLFRANLSGANLIRANLSRADLIEADLRGANLSGANLIRANLRDAKLFDVILPDGTKWTPETDLSRFTNPDHPDFWQPSSDNNS